MACAEHTPFSERSEAGGNVSAHAILVFDPVHPLQPLQVMPGVT